MKIDRVSNLDLHRYTTSELINLRWFIKRIIKPNELDREIRKHINTHLSSNHNILNLGSGYWTPYDSHLRKKSQKLVNCDTTYIAKLFHPFSLKRTRINDDILYDFISDFNIDVVVSFHSISFIHIDLPRLIEFCVKQKLLLLFDWSLHDELAEVDNISIYCYGSGIYEVFQQITKHNLTLIEVETNRQIEEKDFLRVGGRYLFSSQQRD